MKFGVYINPQASEAESAQKLRDGTIGIAKTADEAGFHQVMAGQHYLSDFKQFQLLPFLSRLTGELKSAEIATGVVLLPFYHPVEIAEQIATINALHDNQTVFGVGAGYRDIEFDAFGIPKEERIPRLVEGLELTKRLLAEKDVTYQGDFYSIDDVTLSIRPSELPTIWMGANSNRAVRRAARLADAWLVNPYSTFGEIKEQKRIIYDSIRKERNRDIEIPIFREMFVARSHEEAINTARTFLMKKYQRYISWGQEEAMEVPKDFQQEFQEFAEDRFLLGTPEEVCAEVSRYKNELDAEYLIVRSHWPGMEYTRTQECLELLADEVMPNI